MQSISMVVTDCYECYHFRKDGKFTCQKFPHPRNVSLPSSESNVRYLVPCDVTWRNPDGFDVHCNSFVQYFKDTLF